MVVTKYLTLVTEIAAKHNNFPVDRVMATIFVESMGNENTRNGGLIQVTRPILKKFGGGCNGRKAECSLEAGIAYMDWLYQQTGDYDLVAIAYNRGLAGALRVQDRDQNSYLAKIRVIGPVVQLALNQLQRPQAEMIEASYKVPDNDSSPVLPQ